MKNYRIQKITSIFFVLFIYKFLLVYVKFLNQYKSTFNYIVLIKLKLNETICIMYCNCDIILEQYICKVHILKS